MTDGRTDREKEMVRYRKHLESMFEPYKLLREVAYDLMLLTFTVKDLQADLQAEGKCDKVRTKK